MSRADTLCRSQVIGQSSQSHDTESPRRLEPSLLLGCFVYACIYCDDLKYPFATAAMTQHEKKRLDVSFMKNVLQH